MNMINDPTLGGIGGMLPFDTMGLYEPPKPRFIFKMPRVVPDQKDKFESDDLFRKLSRDGEVSAEIFVRIFNDFRNFPSTSKSVNVYHDKLLSMHSKSIFDRFFLLVNS